MERKSSADRSIKTGHKSGEGSERSSAKPQRKKSEYGRQLVEKQKVKEIYGMRERQFRRFFDIASRSKAATGETLLSLLERRLDNVVYRLKLASSRAQSRQIIVHGHILVDGKKVNSPSYLVTIGQQISIAPIATNKSGFIEQVIDKRLSTVAKVPEWLELDKEARIGRILRLPVIADVKIPIEEHLIVELYSK